MYGSWERVKVGSGDGLSVTLWRNDRGSFKEKRKFSEEDAIIEAEPDFYDGSFIVPSRARAASLPAV